MLLCREAAMHVFDLHCDTLYKSVINKKGIDDCSYEFNLSDFINASKWSQCMAMWIPDDKNELPEIFSDKPLIDFFIFGVEKLISECKRLNIALRNTDSKSKNNKEFILTLENSSILENKIENIDVLEKYNVKIATLTWNDHNCIGDGAEVLNPKGATSFGKEVIKEYIKRNIAIDVSHASDALFYDVASMNPKNILASHSNSRTICSHKRNLTDEQFCYIRDNGGVVGLNFHRYFLSSNGNSSVKDLLNHTYHFLSLGGEDTIALGTDFDGAEMPEDIKGTKDFYKIYNAFLKNGFSKQVTDKIFYENARKFYDKL